MLLDIIFSRGPGYHSGWLSDHLFMMAVVCAVGVMMFAARPIGVDRHPSVKYFGALLSDHG